MTYLKPLFFILSLMLLSQQMVLATSPWDAMSAAPTKAPVAPKDPYTHAAWLGSIVGLGLGHFKQERYWELGWVFTLTEPAAIVGIAFGLLGTFAKDSSQPTLSKWGPELLAVSAAALVGLKAWEISDLWIAENTHRQAVETLNKEKRPNRISFFEPRRKIEILVPIVSLPFN